MGFRTNGIALPRKGTTKEGPGIEPFLARYEICSRKIRRRIKHTRYEVSSVKEKEGMSVRGFIVCVGAMQREWRRKDKDFILEKNWGIKKSE